MSEANKTQVGGDHYKTGTVEHWDVVELQGVGYLEGCATKYVARFRSKGGRQDLEKALHYVSKLAELHAQGNRENRAVINTSLCDRWLRVSQCDYHQQRIILGLFIWRSIHDLQLVRSRIADFISMEYPN